MGDGLTDESKFKGTARLLTGRQLANKLRLAELRSRRLVGSDDPRAAWTAERLRMERRWIIEVQMERARS